MTLSKFSLSLFILFVVGLFATILFPSIDKSFNPGSQYPGMITFAGVGVTLILVTAFVLYLGLRSTVSLKKQFFIYAFTYNAFIVLVKFVLSPSAIYDANKMQTFTNPGSMFGSGSGNPIGLAMVSGVIFVLYFLFFLILYLFKKGKVDKALNISEKTNKKIIRNFSVVLGTVGLLSIIGFLIFGAGALWFFIWFGYDTLSYVGYLSSTVGGVLIALSLISAILFVSAALRDASKQAILLRNAALLSSFFWIAVHFLLIFHALWVVYFLTILSLWPLKVVVSK
jgi:hypothetical protein